MAIELEARDPRWLCEGSVQLLDQCAHARVRLSVDGLMFVSPDEMEITVSAAALYLLRTLDEDHALGDQLTYRDSLFPCCGFDLYPDDGSDPRAPHEYGFVVVGCMNGVDLSVTTADQSVTLRRADATATVTRVHWKTAVLAFATQVESFYERSPARTPPPHAFEREGWELFWQEWHRRVDTARAAMS